MDFIDLKKIKDIVYWKNFLSRFFVLLVGVTLLALNYNLFLVPNSLVIGGTSGLAIIFQKLWGLDPQIFLYIASAILLIISFIFLGKEETMKTLLGSILYPIMVSLTVPIAEYLKNYVTFDSFLVLILIAG